MIKLKELLLEHPLPRFLYHGTVASFLPSIKQHGLKIGGMGHRNWPQSKQGIYLSRDKADAMMFAPGDNLPPSVPDRRIVVLTISARTLNFYKLRPDPNIKGGDSLIYTANIPPQSIARWEIIEPDFGDTEDPENLTEIEGYDPILAKIGLVKRFEIGLRVSYPNLAALGLILRSDGDELHLNNLRVKKKGEGTGGEVMKKILEFADQNRMMLTVHPVPDIGMEQKLYKFYKKYGFIQAHPNWIRYPKS